MSESLRIDSRNAREINRDSFIQEWPDAGLILARSPHDPIANLRIYDGRVVELDGRPESAFDVIDRFIALHAIDVEVADEAMRMEPLAIARMLVDIHIPRQELVRIVGGLTPARLVEVVDCLNVLEMMMALQKMRARKTPSNQAHVTNRKENPALLAA